MPRRRIGASVTVRNEGEGTVTRATDHDPRSERAFGDAARNFQEAAEEFAASAANQASERAAEFLDEAAARLRGEGAADTTDAAAQAAPRGRAGRHRARYGHRYDDDGDRTYRQRGDAGLPRRSRRLYRDVARRRIAGVCAGIANYFGVETWVTRCIAVTGLIFVGQVTLPAYLVAWIVMERAPLPGEPSRRRREEAEPAAPRSELGAGFSPRGRLRALQADATELELRLRRMETHVTSGQYELQRELRDIEAN